MLGGKPHVSINKRVHRDQHFGRGNIASSLIVGVRRELGDAGKGKSIRGGGGTQFRKKRGGGDGSRYGEKKAHAGGGTEMSGGRGSAKTAIRGGGGGFGLV